MGQASAARMSLETIKMQKELQLMRTEKEKKEGEMKEICTRTKSELGETRFVSFFYFLAVFIYFVLTFFLPLTKPPTDGNSNQHFHPTIV